MKIVKSAALALALLILAQATASAQPQADIAVASENESIAEVVAALESITATDEEVSVENVARVLAARTQKQPFSDLRSLGVGLVIIGAGFGIGMLTRSAVESMARQPETASNVQTAMIIAAALIEGVTFFALIIIMLFVPTY